MFGAVSSGSLRIPLLLSNRIVSFVKLHDAGKSTKRLLDKSRNWSSRKSSKIEQLISEMPFSERMSETSSDCLRKSSRDGLEGGLDCRTGRRSATFPSFRTRSS